MYKSQYASEYIEIFDWTGDWDWITPSRDLAMRVTIFSVSTGYEGKHCMVDGRIHGGANDCSFEDENGETKMTLTNSTAIGTDTLEFDFLSGYTGKWGKARIIRVDDNTIRFQVTQEPEWFASSPLGNILYLTEGLGPDATGGVDLAREN